jgi:hypothetical protein
VDPWTWTPLWISKLRRTMSFHARTATYGEAFRLAGRAWTTIVIAITS